MRSTAAVSVLRVTRFWSAAKGIGAPAAASQASTSPSSTRPVPSASTAAASMRPARSISGKRSVTSSSPRDHSQQPPARSTSCARMPSHFHSTSQSPDAPSVAGSACSGWARKNGYGWPASAGSAGADGSAGATSARKRAASGAARASVQPIIRCASSFSSSPETRAIARSTSSRETPTRKPPVMSFDSTKRPFQSRPAHQARSVARASSGAAPRSEGRRSPIQTDSPTSSATGASGSRCAIVSARSPTAW